MFYLPLDAHCAVRTIGQIVGLMFVGLATLTTFPADAGVILALDSDRAVDVNADHISRMARSADREMPLSSEFSAEQEDSDLPGTEVCGKRPCRFGHSRGGASSPTGAGANSFVRASAMIDVLPFVTFIAVRFRGSAEAVLQFPQSFPSEMLDPPRFEG